MIKPISIVSNAVKHELNIVKDTKRAGEIAKSLYPNSKLAAPLIGLKKMGKEVGPEPVIGTILGTYTNPIPGMCVLGYMLGRGVAEGRKLLVKTVKNLLKK